MEEQQNIIQLFSKNLFNSFLHIISQSPEPKIREYPNTHGDACGQYGNGFIFAYGRVAPRIPTHLQINVFDQSSRHVSLF